MRSVCGDPLPCPAIAMPGHQAVADENAGDQIIAGDQHQLPDGCDDIGGGAVALSAPALRQAQLGMGAANPMDNWFLEAYHYEKRRYHVAYAMMP